MSLSVRYTRRATLVGLATLPLSASDACSGTSGRATASILDYLPAAQHAAIAAGTSRFDCAPALQRAIDQTAGQTTTLTLPAGRYIVMPATKLDHADPRFPCLTALLMRSGMHLRGTAQTHLQIPDQFSTDALPRAMAMFGSDVPLHSIAIEQLVVDMNGARNPISPSRNTHYYSRAPQAHIFVSGRPGGQAAKIDDIAISDCRFTGSNGVSCIVMGQTENSESLGSGWHIRTCTFADNGDDTDDHSSIYGYADDVVIENCLFTNRKLFDGRGGNTGYEVHGSNHQITGNIFRNYMRGIWVANNMASTVTNTRIVRNTFNVMFYGVDFFNNTSLAHSIKNTIISDNLFTFDDAGFDTIPQLNLKVAVQIASEYAQTDVTIQNNRMTKAGTKVASAFVVVTGGAEGTNRHNRIFVKGNRGEGMTFGSFLRTTPTAGLGSIAITDNVWTNLTPAGAFMVATGDGVERSAHDQPIQSLTLGGGRVIETRASRRPVPAVVINGWVKNLTLSPISLPNGQTDPLVFGGAGRVDSTRGTISVR
jgi:hypothetical protein